jgi:hypothetical protein
MFRIRKEQMDHFRARGRARYLDRLTEYVRERHPSLAPAEAAKAAGFRERIRTLVEKSDGYGFRIELETTQLVLLLLRFGDDADERLPWFAEPLRARHLLPIGKVRKIVETARARGEQGVDPIDISAPEHLSSPQVT